jgi:hypothetical protein
MKAKIFSFLCKISGFANFSKIYGKFYDLLGSLAAWRAIYFSPALEAAPQRFVKTFGFGLYSF